MDAKLALTGALPFLIILAALLSAPLCALLLGLYRRAVIRGMAQQAGLGVGPPNPQVGPALGPLELQRLNTETTAIDSALSRHARWLPWRSAAIYLAAGLVYALIMSAAFLSSSQLAWLPLRTSVLVLAHLWPALLAVMWVAAYDTRHRGWLLGAYFSLFLLLSIAGSQEGPAAAALSALLLWGSTNALPTALATAFMWRRIRAVGPLVLTFMLLSLLGSQVLVSALQGHEVALRRVVQLGSAVGLGGAGTFFALLALGMVGAAALAWPLLKFLGRRYQARALSEVSLTLDALFLLFAIVQAVGLVFQGPAWALAGPVAFIAARFTAALLWRLLPSSPAASPRLLVLRVFALGARSERLFDRLRKHWQGLGPMAMIAGPDLVTSTVEPHEFLDFVAGHLARQFVTGPADLQARLAAFDARPAPDGQHRIDELFCRADTWQMSMQRLAAASDAVLMDLRSFSPTNQGCRYEIGRLLDSVDLRRVVVLIDQTTDMPHLQLTLQSLWQAVATTSPNRRPGVRLRLLQLDRPGYAQLHGLMGHLLQR